MHQMRSGDETRWYLEYDSGVPDMALQVHFGYSLFTVPSPLKERPESRTVVAVSILWFFLLLSIHRIVI